MQDEVFPDRDHFGRIFYNQAIMSKQSIPQIACVMGSCTAGGAYVPAMSDETVIVMSRAPSSWRSKLVKRDRRGRHPGGARRRRPAPKTSGVTDHLALTTPTRCTASGRSSTRFRLRRRLRRCARPARLREQTDLYDIVPVMPSPTTSARSSRPSSTPASTASSSPSTHRRDRFARIHGHPVGIVANNGILFSESAQKGAHFIELCNQRGIPLVFLQNITGFMVGRKYENAGIAKDGAKMVTAVACSSVPKFTVVIGGSFGAGNYGMCGRAYGARFLWMWPNAGRVMGGEQAASPGHGPARPIEPGGEWSAEEQEGPRGPSIA